jgi:3-deoxy-D-manno-octulosonate 8-phosphate phosphatase (KDO 8-P phosphatase)
VTDLSNIALIIFDVDGVLTDGSIIVDDHGIESKRFHVRDGFAIKAAARVGLKVGVITGRSSRVVTLRMGELGVDLFVQGAKDKGAAFEQLCDRSGVEAGHAAYMGDDLIDLPAMMRCGLPLAVADAVPEVKQIARHTTHAAGGHGAAREAIEYILKAQHKWAKVVEMYAM